MNNKKEQTIHTFSKKDIPWFVVIDDQINYTCHCCSTDRQNLVFLKLNENMYSCDAHPNYVVYKEVDDFVREFCLDKQINSFGVQHIPCKEGRLRYCKNKDSAWFKHLYWTCNCGILLEQKPLILCLEEKTKLTYLKQVYAQIKGQNLPQRTENLSLF